MAPERIDALQSVAGGNGRGGGSSSSLSLGRTLVCFEDRADVYAFALLLWELFHERRAFEGMSGEAAALSALQGNRPQFSKPSTRDRIQTLTAECWAQRPEDRPSMSTVLERLEPCMQPRSLAQSVASTNSSWYGPPLPRPSSCSDESSTAAVVPINFSSTYFSSKVGGLNMEMDFDPWVEPVERDRE
jgi:hypothetical protein